MTNYKKIKSLTIEEMAIWLETLINDEHNDWNPPGCFRCVNYGTHHYPGDCGECEFLGGLKQWLSREVTE